MKRFLATLALGLLAVVAVAGPASARTFGAVYANDSVYRVFGNAANVPDGTGTDPFATFTNSTNGAQLGVAELLPGPRRATTRPLGRVPRDLDHRRPLDAGDQLGTASVARVERSAHAGPRCGGGLPLPGAREP